MMGRQREYHASTLRKILRFSNPLRARFRNRRYFKENN